MDIAIVGMSCRLPGARNVAEFWELIANGRSAISEVPPWRWDTSRLYHPDPSVPGKANTKWGGFLEDVELFDCDFFAMSAEEVPNVDPQQRLMLELGYEALEDAGIAPSSLRETRTGVYVGISHNDYDRIIYRDYARITRHHGTGSYQSVAANRLSYFLDIVGPSMTVDTACSSGLTAVHIACRDLWERQVPLALVGAVTLHLTPDETIGLTKGRLLSGEGKCKSFDESADGYVRGEGGVVLVMRRLDDALAAGDTVLAVVKGSAVNHNGRSNGLTAPSGRALKAVMEEALTSSGVGAGDVSFVETHGTGTLMGDQLELKALKEVYGSRAHEGSCWLGCVKTNIGHLETTSGLASMVKMILAMRHGRIPANLNLVKPVRRADLLESRLAFPTRLEPWTAGPSPRVGALTAYGFGGANAHVIVQEAPPAVARPAASATLPQVLCLSARTERALAALLARYSACLAHTDDSLESICYTANVGRTHFSRRIAFVASGVEELRREIERAALAGPAGTETSRPPKLVFECSNESELTRAHRRLLMSTHAAYREASERVAQLVRARLHIDLEGAPEEPLSELSRAAKSFAHQYAAAAMWQAFGVKPAAIVGDGIGRLVADAVTGALDVGEAVAAIAPAVEHLRDLVPRDAPATASGHVIVVSLAGSSSTNAALMGELARLYTLGAAVDFAVVLRSARPARASLPTYPFQRERLWFDPPGVSAPGAAATGTSAPLGAPAAAGAAPRAVVISKSPMACDDAREDMTVWLSELIGGELQLTADDVDADRPFAEYGVDSAIAVEIATKVQTRIGRDLDQTLLWSYPNITTLARHLEGLLLAAP